MAIRQVNLAELKQHLADTPQPRRIDEVILHHTWKPTAAQYAGPSTWKGVRRYHMNERGWSDIGYHIGVGPDDSIWLLRPIERSGAHCLNHNAHSIGVVMIGNFDEEDPWENGAQMAAEAVAAICKRYELSSDDVRFHREFANKTCPGNCMPLYSFRAEVDSAMNSASPLKIVLRPGSKVIDCRPRIEDGVTRCDLRALAEALGYEVYDHISDENKIYVRNKGR